MDPETVIQIIFEWKYIWWFILGLYILSSEILYWMSCKFKWWKEYDGKDSGWFYNKITSFSYGSILTLALVLLFSFITAIVINIFNNPLLFLKIIGITIGVIVIIFLFFFANYKIWERYN